MYVLRSDVFPSFILVLLGSLDCLTTAVGVLYFGAAEWNPFMRSILSTSIAAFLVLKISATLLIGSTYVLAKRTLNKSPNKESQAFKISNKLMDVTYIGLIVFLVVVVVNNIVIILV